MSDHRFELWEITLDGETAQVGLVDLQSGERYTIARMKAMGWRKLANLSTQDEDEARKLATARQNLADWRAIRDTLDQLGRCHCDCGARFWAQAELVVSTPTAAIRMPPMILADRPCPECGRVDDVKRVSEGIELKL